MNASAVVTFLLIGGFLWGGLTLILATAVRKERDRGAGE
jgi:hypothetical protein